VIIRKIEYKNKRTAKHSISGMHGVKHIRFDSAVVYLVDFAQKNQVENTAMSHGGHTVNATPDDKEKLIRKLAIDSKGDKIGLLISSRR
jgi:hypothetical protein